jgi:exonuclease III
MSGIDILNDIARNRRLDDSQVHNISKAIEWIASPRTTIFRDTDQLISTDFPTYTAEICTALLLPPAPLTTQMNSTEWVYLQHHTASTSGNTLPTLMELLRIVKVGNLAILLGHHYWLYPLLYNEESICHSALEDLTARIWDAHVGIRNCQLMVAPVQWPLWTDEEVQFIQETAAPQGPTLADHDGVDCLHLVEVSEQQELALLTSNSTKEQVDDIGGVTDQTKRPRDWHEKATQDMEISNEGSIQSMENLASVPIDPTAIFALQEQLFTSESYTDNILETGVTMKAHIRSASLNINGLTQQKLPIILTYIKKKKIDVLTLQDTRLDERDSQLIATLIRKHYQYCNVQTRIAPVPSAIKRADRVGGQLVIVAGKWASRVTGFTRDFTNMGLLTGITLQAHSHKILILSTYFPIRPVEQCDNSQLWNKVVKHLREHENYLDPLEFIQYSVQEKIKDHIKKSDDNIAILQGDLNSTWGTTAVGGCHKNIEQWAQSISLSNPLHTLSLHLSKPLCTHWMARHIGFGAEHIGVSWIDHILLHSSGRPSMVRGGCEDHNDWIIVSDHRPIWIDINLPLGRTADKLIQPYDLQPLSGLDRTNIKQVARYQKLIENKISRLPSSIPCEELIQEISHISVDACNRVTRRPKTFYNCTKFKDGWSPLLVAKLAALNAITTMRQHITGAHRRKLWWRVEDIEMGIKRITMEWENKVRQLQFDTQQQHEEAHLMGKGPVHWRLIEKKFYPRLAEWLRETELQIKKKMHGRQRSLERLQMQNASAERERAVSAGKIGKAIKSILGKSQMQYDLHSLQLPSGEIITDPLNIHDTHVAHWKEWLQGTHENTFFDEHTIDWENPHQKWPEFRDYPAHKHIPKQLVQRIWTAIMQPTQDTKTRQEIGEALSQPVTIEDLRQAIRTSPSGSVPGPSGLSYAMMKEWPESVLTKAHAAMSEIWEQKIIPSCWNKKWLCPKPKIQPDQATLQDLRPLNLLETPRKLLMGIVVKRITAIWERNDILSNSQYGFRNKRSCEGPTLQVLNAQEEAEESGTELHGSSWDIRRAFDSVPKEVLVMSWERLGVPSVVANYIVDLDRDCLTVPLTPHAQHIRQKFGLHAFGKDKSTGTTAQGFLGITGTSQGDTPSPSNWTATFDIPLRALEQEQSHPFLVRTDIEILKSQDLAFADDVYSFTSRREGLQEKADIMSASAIILGVSFATQKLRTNAITWGQEPSGYNNQNYQLQVYNREWIPSPIQVKYANTESEDQSFRYLGVQMDIKNSSAKQLQILKDQIQEATNTARHKLASPDTITMAVKLSLHRQISFPGKFSPWSLEELRTLDTPLNGLYKYHLKFMQSAPNAALYMSKEVGGLGIARLSDQINIDKWTMLIRGLYSDHATCSATKGILNRCLRIGQTDTDYGYEAMVQPAGVPQLMRSLIELMDESGYQLRRSGQDTTGSPSQLIIEQFDITNKRIKRKLMNYRLTTVADLMKFQITGNSWNDILTKQFSTLSPPPLCPPGRRLLRIGQYWASSKFEGQNGVIVEIMGIHGNQINGRSWITAIPSSGWAGTGATRGRLTWVTPRNLSDSRGAGATEHYDIDLFLSSELMLYTLSEEVPRFRSEKGINVNCVARAIRSCHEEVAPTLPKNQSAETETEEIKALITTWEVWGDELYCGEVEVYTDGSMRYYNSAYTRVLTQPNPLRKPVHAQGGILVNFGRSSDLNDINNNVTVTLEHGVEIDLLLPSSIELYTILLAVKLLHRAKMQGTIYTDFAEAVRMQNREKLRNWGRKANLPIYETIINLLETAPGIKIAHIKAHGDKKKQSTWTRQQWGNYYADRLAKGDEEIWSTRHMRWPIQDMERLVMNISPWHWISSGKHLLLEPIHQLIQTKILEVYLIDRDIYRVGRGLEEKWQEVHLGFIEDVWTTKKLKMGKMANLNRLIWDRGWHGGNRAKTTSPMGTTQEEWISCGDCGLPDSQNHWIRECSAEHIKTVRIATKGQVYEQLEKIQLSKGRKAVRNEIHSACTELVDEAYYGEGGEQLWVGILPKRIVSNLAARLPKEQAPNDKMQIPNRWRHNILRILKLLAGGTQLAWQAKEKARSERLRGIEKINPTARNNVRRRTRNQDIRIVYRRAAYEQAQRQEHERIRQEFESIASSTLLNETSTAPINAIRRLRRMNTARALKTKRTSKHHWAPSHEQEWFALPREHSNKILTLKTGKGHEHRRNLRARNWHTIFDMGWLKDYDDRHIAEGDAEMTVESEELHYSPSTSCSIHNKDIDNNIKIDSMNVCYDTNALASSREGIG